MASCYWRRCLSDGDLGVGVVDSCPVPVRAYSLPQSAMPPSFCRFKSRVADYTLSSRLGRDPHLYLSLLQPSDLAFNLTSALRYRFRPLQGMRSWLQ